MLKLGVIFHLYISEDFSMNIYNWHNFIKNIFRKETV